MKRITAILAGTLLLPALALAAPNKPTITVMTQNQYLGADLNPIIGAATPAEYNLAVLEALFSIADNNIRERVVPLAESIIEKKADLVGLQEVFRFDCIESGSIPDACLLFSAAMNDHLELTLGALDDLGADYYVAAVVENLVIPSAGFAYPGLPVFLNPEDEIPDIFIQVLDRDVILARSDVETDPLDIPCANTSADGCNYNLIASATTLAGVIDVQRGFVGVEATVNGSDYWFINTHLEVQYPAPDPDAPLIQAAQASQLIGTLSLMSLPPDTGLLVVGDINSSLMDPVFLSSLGWTRPPYSQFITGLSLVDDPISLPYYDTWDLRPGKPPGYTCCQAADLSNDQSDLDERIDVIFSLDAPHKTKANTVNHDPDDKTPGGLWPSDHASVVARLYD